MLINGTYLGLLIRGMWGDWFRITVVNNLENDQDPKKGGNGTAIHWHGLRQFRTVWSDGVPGVTQCPIPPGKSQTYVWRATQYGTSWYHSHFSLQYADGIAGPLVIDGPTTSDYDEDKGPLMLTDWYHASAFSLYYQETRPVNGGPPPPDSYLINGLGMYTTKYDKQNSTVLESKQVCESDGRNSTTGVGCYPLGWKGMYVSYVEYGKKYKLRLINTSAATHFSFWIDSHELSIVATDFVPIEPYHVPYINVAIGQRYDIIVEAKQMGKGKFRSPNFWIKMRPCNSVCIGDPCESPPCNYVECRQGVLSYNLTSPISADENWRKPVAPSQRCSDPPRNMLKPWVRRDLSGHILPNLRFKSPFLVENKKGTQVPPTSGQNVTEVNLWDIKYNDNDYSFMIDWARPTFELVHEDKPIDPRYVPIEVNGQESEWTVFAIVSNWTNSGDPDDAQHAVPGAAHPIHLHGHDFVILSQVENTKNSSKDATFSLNNVMSLDLFNPPRRDVVMLPVNGYVIIAFRLDNPGVWLMHCHIAWHASAGLALQWIEGRHEIPKLMKGDKGQGVMSQMHSQCRAWDGYYSNSTDKQDDSGI